MDVLHVIHQFAPESHGGSETYLLDLVRRQRARGLDVQVLSGSKHPRDAVVVESGEFEGIPVHRLHRNDIYFEHFAKMWHPEVEQTFEELLKKWRPKLVHVHHWLRLSCNLVEVAARLDIPAVVTLHDYYTSCPRVFRQRPGESVEDLSCRRELSAEGCAKCVPAYGYEPWHERAAAVELFADHYRAELALARAVLVSVGSTADLLARATGVPRERYDVLPLGYEERFADLPKLSPPREGEAVRFAYWGTIGRHKGIDVLVRAFAMVHDALPGRVELDVFGESDSEELLEKLRSNAGERPVRFHGAFDAAALHAVAPHVGVFPSTCLETYGLVLDECFELGRPCITSDLGAIAERGAVAGLTTKAGDAADLAAALRRFVDEPALWQDLAAQVPAHATSRDEHLEALLAVYERARNEPVSEPDFPAVPALRRLMFLQLQRESALNRARDGGGPA